MKSGASSGLADQTLAEIQDQSFMSLPARHEAVLNDLLAFLTGCQGIALVVAEGNFGRTMLIPAILQRLPQNYQPLVLGALSDEPMALMVDIAAALGINIKEGNLVSLTPLADTLQAWAREGKFAVVLMEEAQQLKDRHLEEIRVLSHFEFYGQNLLPMVLVGSKELEQKLEQPGNERLRQLVTAKFTFPVLMPAETGPCLDLRRKTAEEGAEPCCQLVEDLDLAPPVAPDAGLGASGPDTGPEAEPEPPETLPPLREAEPMAAEPLPPAEILAPLREAGVEDEGPLFPPGVLVPPPRISISKVLGTVAAVLVLLVAGYRVYHHLADKAAPPVIGPTTAWSGRLPEKDLSRPGGGGEAPGQIADLKAPGRSELPGLEPVASLPPQTREAAPGAPAVSQAEPAEVAKIALKAKAPTFTTYQVTREDRSLYSIVSRNYEVDQKLGFAALLLANPQISNENLIYPGQQLSLPRVDEAGVILLKDGRYYFFLDSYLNASQVQKAQAKLEAQRVSFMVRKSQYSGAGSVYRLFVGGYESEEGLRAAVQTAQGE